MAPEQKKEAPSVKKIPKDKKFWVRRVAMFAGVFVVIAMIATIVWYQVSLQPVNTASQQTIRFTIKTGEGVGSIASNLQKAKLIRSADAMLLYLKLKGSSAHLQAGSYVLTQKQSLSEIVEHIEKGKTDLMFVTILPGRTLQEIQKDLTKYGYSEQEIKTAFAAQYDSPLLADKPTDADLEGYIFPETFEVNAEDDLQKLLQRSFDTLYTQLKRDGYIDKFAAQGLNLHQAVTLASIIQKEASNPADQPQIAQVFLTRMKMGMKLESDVTFHYGAEKLGVAPRVNLDSPYNTRLVAGLPPTPISNMNYSALRAVASPASGDYIYFIAGDNGKIYYGHTLDDHNQNIKKYCQKLCGNAY